MTLPTTQEEKTASSDNSLVLAAVGILAYAASTMTHEALGHGMYCLAANGHNTMLTAWQETCAFPGVAPLGVKAAGPAAQFAAGLLAWAALHLGLVVEVRLRYFLWLYMTYSLFIVSSYIAFSGMTDFGVCCTSFPSCPPPQNSTCSPGRSIRNPDCTAWFGFLMSASASLRAVRRR